MRTTIVIDDDLMAAAMRASGLRTKRAVVEMALKTLVRLEQQSEVRTLRGTVTWEGDLQAMRADRFP